MQYDLQTHDDRLAATVDSIGKSPVLQVFEGELPRNCAAADAGRMLVRMALPRDWLTRGLPGQLIKQGKWTGLAHADGKPRFFRINDIDGKCRLQGSAGMTDAEMLLGIAEVKAGQVVEVKQFEINSPQ